MSEITTIVNSFLPNLVAGKYEVEVNQKVIKKEEILQQVTKKMVFGVNAARFTLNPDDLYSVYPPANTTGRYKNNFPHVVFSRKTLPWERTIDGNAPPANENLKPWMALLLLEEEEMKTLKIETNSLKELLYQENPTDGISRPKIWNKNHTNEILTLMEWEQEDQKCLTIDITKEQFIQYIPKSDELPFLAHSKKVVTTHKDKNGIDDITDDTAYFSVLMGNRFIKQDKAYTAIVVALEGHQEYIENNSLLLNQVRLVVLANWKFSSEGSTSFETILKNIEVQKMSLEHASQNNTLKEYLKYGYAPMRHLMRNGGKNISWYRGPFVPQQTSFDINDTIKFSSSDTALYYDTDTGLLDVSIAAAWELGKIIALKNQEFAKAMIDWNNNPFLSETNNDIENPNKTDVLNWLQNIEKPKSILQGKNTLKSYKPFPDVVIAFLKELAALKGVPLSYLIPDKKYITKTTGDSDILTVFHLDPKWIFALLDGAVSLTGLRLLDTKTQVEGIINEVYDHSVCSGFLLHSKIVSGWRGLEIKAFDQILKEPMKNPIRFERITPELFLGIFKGTIKKLNIKQPYEGLHFGIKEKVNSNEVYEKAWKLNNGSIDNKNIIEITKKSILKDNQVIRVSEIINSLKAKTQNTDFSPADFAFQMIDSPMEGNFEINYNIKL
jgi:hypothetical protein